ncbi:hypothetical protein K501DRAFT_248399, partial [Backusella circina FSU 941]
MSKKEFNLDDLDELLNANINQHDEEGLDDPELLSQLQALSSSSKPEKKKEVPKQRVQQVQDMEIDIDAYHALAQGNDDDINVEFDEEDMNDPNLLGELSAIGGTDSNRMITDDSETDNSTVSELTNMGFTVKQAQNALNKFDNNLERATNYLLDNPQQQQEDETTQQQQQQQKEDDDEEEEESLDPEYYKQKAQEYQKLALMAKKQGDKKKAIELLRESKVFKQKYEDTMVLTQSELNNVNKQSQPMIPQQVEQSIPVQTKQASSSPLLEEEEIVPIQQQRTPSPPLMTSPQVTIPAAKLEKAQETLQQVIKLQKEYKEAALHYKNLGNLSVARQMVKTSKELLHTGIQLKNGEIFDANLPNRPDMTLGDGKMHQVMEQPITNISSTSQIENQLGYQLNVSHNLAIQNNSASNNKKNKMTMSNRDHFAALEHALQADLLSLKGNSTDEIPPLHFEQVNYTYQNVIDTVPSTMMEFKIIKATSLPTLDISTHLNPFVTWDFNGWPPENAAQAAMNKGETPIAEGIEPEFQFSTQIPITRTNRAFLRYLQRKKLTVEVYHNKYTYGLFRRPVLLGKAIIPMETLLTKSSISGAFDLVDSNRKKSGGKIHLQINLREPLTCQDIVDRAERWLVLDAYGSTVSRCLSAAGLTQGGPILPSDEEESKSSKMTTPEIGITTPSSINTPPPSAVNTLPPPTKAPEVSKETVIKKPEPAKSTKQDENQLEKAEEEFNSVDSIVSNMVLEHEMKLVDASTSGNKEDLMDRKQALEIKMNMLVIQVQTGLLDMETYLSNVQKRMDEDRQLAIIFKKFNRLDLAKAALVRKKIMQDELEEARAAMEAEDE